MFHISFLPLFFSFQEIKRALASVVQLVRCHPINQKVTGLIPGQSTGLGCGVQPARGNQSIFSQTSMFSSSLWSSLPFSLQSVGMFSSEGPKELGQIPRSSQSGLLPSSALLGEGAVDEGNHRSTESVPRVCGDKNCTGWDACKPKFPNTHENRQ